jgi:hypothetical protein
MNDLGNSPLEKPVRHLSRANSVVLSAATQAALAMFEAQKAAYKLKIDSDDSANSDSDNDENGAASDAVSRQNSRLNVLFPSKLLPIKEMPIQSEEGVVITLQDSKLPNITAQLKIG